jgi:flagellar motor component MotA
MSPETSAAISSVVAQVGTLENAFKLGGIVAIALVAGVLGAVTNLALRRGPASPAV